MVTAEQIALDVLGANLSHAEDASKSDEALRTVAFSGDRVRIMLTEAANEARAEMQPSISHTEAQEMHEGIGVMLDWIGGLTTEETNPPEDRTNALLRSLEIAAIVVSDTDPDGEATKDE